jgi:hypothetical protein
MTDQLDDGAEQRFRRVALILSTSVWTWVEEAGLGIVEGHVLLALSGTDGAVDAIEISARSRLSLDTIFPALNRLTGRRYALEEHRDYRLTEAGRRLVADFDRAASQECRPGSRTASPETLAKAAPSSLREVMASFGATLPR